MIVNSNILFNLSSFELTIVTSPFEYPTPSS